VVGAALVGQGTQRRRAVLLGQQAQHRHAELLVVVQQVAHRSRQVADGRLVPLAADAFGLAFGGGGQQPLLAPEAADDGLHRDPGARATSSSGMSSTGRCQNMATAASTIRSPVAAAALARACIR
jgi:hypothetical protein